MSIAREEKDKRLAELLEELRIIRLLPDDETPKCTEKPPEPLDKDKRSVV
jgi:hypothetical protein